MWHRRRHANATDEHTGASDPLASAIWREGHLTGGSAQTPVINAPRAGDLTADTTAA
jgi:hypothetical protein